MINRDDDKTKEKEQDGCRRDKYGEVQVPEDWRPFGIEW